MSLKINQRSKTKNPNEKTIVPIVVWRAVERRSYPIDLRPNKYAIGLFYITLEM